MKHEHEPQDHETAKNEPPVPAEHKTAKSDPAPAPPKTPEPGTIVQYTDSDVVCPAMVIGAHDDGTVDLRVEYGYALGSHDRQNVALSDLGSPGTYMEAMPKKEREEKIKAALEKKAKEQEKANAEAEAEREKRQKEQEKQLSHKIADLHKRTGELQQATQ